MRHHKRCVGYHYSHVEHWIDIVLVVVLQKLQVSLVASLFAKHLIKLQKVQRSREVQPHQPSEPHLIVLLLKYQVVSVVNQKLF